MELLVVIAIIGIATAMALPSLNKFMKGQRLSHAGRMIQSVFNDARRASITQRAKHHVFFGRYRTPGSVTPDIYALHIFRDGVGWEPGEPTKLPASVQPVVDNESAAAPVILGCRLTVQDWTDGLPPPAGGAWGGHAAGENPFSNQKKVANTATYPYHEIRKDGTIVPKNAGSPVANATLFDLNATITDASVFKLATFKTSPFCDIAIKQIGEPSKMCYVSIDLNTGRVRFRVVDGEDIAQ